MALLESRLRYGCCGRAGFRAKYNDELKGKITEKLLKRDLKDISEEFRKFVKFTKEKKGKFWLVCIVQLYSGHTCFTFVCLKKDIAIFHPLHYDFLDGKVYKKRRSRNTDQ